MPRVRRPYWQPRPAPQSSGPQRLPQRWAIIAMVTAAAATVAHLAGGPIAAITVGAAVLVAAHRVLD
ncbi:hypothetical protein [Micromonospora inositola]|uniref:Uncharacterized protein n=1 Tax=Micromonospora inositola TaxID=47865 RepID=A0A1C5JMF2_9ACTN|nr:hypothetical protein [Micromonospora inositola]SCG71745.1 hypothetical protein GA0070613_4967 [Micromonospora inositola]